MKRIFSPLLIAISLLPQVGWAGRPADLLPDRIMMQMQPTTAPVDNAAFVPGKDAQPAPPFTGILQTSPAPLQSLPALTHRMVDRRDALTFPGLALGLFTLGETLVPVQRGEMIRETRPGETASYWRVIPQFGRVWREPADEGWSRGALPLMLVNDTENHAHQGLATFLYKDGRVSNLRVQFVQQTAPYLLSPYCVLWGVVPLQLSAGTIDRIDAETADAKAELAARLPARPLAELRAAVPRGTLDGFGGPVNPEWQVALGLVHKGTLFYETLPTAYGPYPYPLEMRFGVRSVMKSVATPLSLLHLAEVYGPYVLNLRIGDYVSGLDPKWQRIRFVDAANMATGFGGTGSFKTNPNDINDGYLDADYDGWYTAHSNAAKIRHINEHLKPYPWEPGTVMRYRDQDFYLLGIAVDAFLKQMRGPDADAWNMLRKEVFEPIGIYHAPAVRTREEGGREGPVWFNAGYYPSLDDLAKIALLYEDGGAHDGKQILHRGLTEDLLAARGTIDKNGDGAAGPVDVNPASPALNLYRMGFHYSAYESSKQHRRHYLPTMEGYGDNEVILFPGRVVAIRMAKVTDKHPKSGPALSEDLTVTLRAVDRLSPF
jgi:hypothetical protein